MANLRKLFARKEPQEKMHGEKLGNIFIDHPGDAANDAARAYLDEHGSARELDFAKIYLQTEMNKLLLKTNTRRNDLLSAAIHYASKKLNQDGIQGITAQIYNTSIDVCAELMMTGFLESHHSHHDKDHCIKLAQNLDAAYLQQKRLEDALSSLARFQAAPAVEKEKEVEENTGSKTPEMNVM